MNTYIQKFDYFLEKNEYIDSYEVENIIKKISSSQYLSKSTREKVNKSFRSFDFLDKIENKIKSLISFFKTDINYIDDCMLQYFDFSGYNYNVYLGYQTGEYPNHVQVLIDKEYFKNKNKENYLLCQILSLIKEFKNKEFEDFLEKRDKHKNTRNWIAHPRNRMGTQYSFLSGLKSFKDKIDIRNINPFFLIKAEHKEKEDYFNYNQEEDYVILNGWSSSEIDNTRMKIIDNSRIRRIGNVDWRSCRSHSIYDTYDENYSNRKSLSFEIKISFEI